MPVVKIDQLNPQTAVGVWKIEETEEELYALMCKDPVMQLPADDISNSTKKKEWMAGRLVLKAIVEGFGLKYEGIYKDKVGKPHLNIYPHHISLTHSFPWVGAIMCEKGAVGIDLEQPKEKLQRVAYKFLNKEEMLHANNTISKLCIYWCAKEALYKSKGKKGIIFKEDIALEPFEVTDDFGIRGTIIDNGYVEEYRLRALRMNKTYMVYTLN